MPDDLVRTLEPEGLSKIDPQVRSLARPTASALLQARADIQREASLQELFREARERGHTPEWIADNLSIRLAGIWGGNFAEAVEASRYLADEYFQLGQDAIVLVSQETGQVIAQLSEDDLYDPEPVRREASDHLAQPLRRIRPELAGFIATWNFEKAQEERITALLAARANQTALLRDEGDRRLWMASREGRERVARALSEDHPLTLLEQAGGTAGAFLRHFDLSLDSPPSGALSYRLEASHSILLVDPTTLNLSYDRLGSLRGVLAQTWIRQIAGQLSHAVHGRGRSLNWSVDQLSQSEIEEWQTWAAHPDVYLAFRNVAPKLACLPTESVLALGLTGKVGTIYVPASFASGSREIFARWVVRNAIQVAVQIDDWSKLVAATVSGVTFQPTVL